MSINTLGRRDFIRYSVLASIFGLTSCGFSTPKAVLLASNGVLPKELLKALPAKWKVQLLQPRSESGFVFNEELLKDIDLLALGDGWLSNLSSEILQPLKLENFSSRLNFLARSFLLGLGPDFTDKVFPIALSPWVMLFRKGDLWLKQANESWEVLLEPDLKENIVFPNSARLVMSIAEKLGGRDELIRLRLQAKSFDGRNGLNWLLSGKAKVAVLPLQQCMLSLSRDPRLSVALPKSGSPLNWTVITRPIASREIFPELWIKQAWDLPLLGRMISRGWIPPIAFSELRKAVKFVPDRYQSVLLPTEEVLENCWTLPPLTALEQQAAEERWINSTP